MRFQTPLQPARLIRRYKRFLADAMLADGTEVTAHCANPGSMMGLADPGTQIWLEPNDDPKKKLKYAWRLVDHENGHFTGVDTGVPNRLLRHALTAGTVAGLEQYKTVRPEQKYGGNSRIDFLLQQSGLPDLYLEVKSVTLSRSQGLAEFPDSVTARGTKHLRELANLAGTDSQAMLLYVVQRTDCSRVSAAADLDPAYAAALTAARSAGVGMMALDCNVTPSGITLRDTLAVL